MLPSDHQLGAREPDRNVPESSERSWVAIPRRADKLLGLLSQLLEIHVDLLPIELVPAASRKKTNVKQ